MPISGATKLQSAAAAAASIAIGVGAVSFRNSSPEQATVHQNSIANSPSSTPGLQAENQSSGETPYLLELPPSYEPAFSIVREPLRAELVKRVRAEFSEREPTSGSELTQLLSDSMLNSGFSPRETYRTVQAMLALGALPYQETSEAVTLLNRLFPEIVGSSAPIDESPGTDTAELIASGLTISWFNSGNDPFGYGKLEMEREEKGNAQWVPEPGVQLPVELWISTYPFSRKQSGVSEGDSMVLDYRTVAWAATDSNQIYLDHAASLQFKEQIGAGFNTRQIPLELRRPDIGPRAADGPPPELVLRLSYTMSHKRPLGTAPTPDTDGPYMTTVGGPSRGENFFLLKPVLLHDQHIGYSVEPLGLDGKPLEAPALGEGFIRTALYNMLFLRKESFQARAIGDREATRARDAMHTRGLPSIGLIQAPPETGAGELPVFNSSSPLDPSTFPGVINADKDLHAYLKGKVTLIDFWTTWCAPCLASIPTLNTLQREGQIQVVGLLDGASPRNLKNMAETIRGRDIQYPVGVVDEKTFSRVGGTGYPYYVLVDWREGDTPTVVWSQLGSLDPDALKEKLPNLPPPGR